MRLLIGYDGSTCSDSAIENLQRAGFPADAEAHVLTVADVWLPPREPDRDQSLAPAIDEKIYARALELRKRALSAIEESRHLATKAADRLRTLFPDWSVTQEALADSPPWGIIKKADELMPDLIVVGSHGRSALGRLVLGSVSQTVLTQASFSVRVSKFSVGATLPTVRIVIGFDGSPGADGAIRAVCGRSWPTGSEARIVAVIDENLLTAASPESAGEGDDWIHRLVKSRLELIEQAGLVASYRIENGDPRKVMVSEAQDWGADCVFMGARGLRRLDRLLLGSVSSAVAARAHCSVEVVRRFKAAG